MIKKCPNISVISMLTILVMLLHFSHSPSSSQSSDTLGYKILSIKKGDRCIVCNTPLTPKNGLSLLVRGRRVTIDLEHWPVFLNNQLIYFSDLQPKGALFQENAIQDRQINAGWFIFGIWVILALLSSAINAGLSLKKGLPILKWFFRGLVLNIAGVFWLLLHKPAKEVVLPPNLGKIPVTRSPVKCPKCNGFNHPAAKICAGCGGQLYPKIEAEVNRAGL